MRTTSVLKEFTASDTIKIYGHILIKTMCDETGLVPVFSCSTDRSTQSSKNLTLISGGLQAIKLNIQIEISTSTFSYGKGKVVPMHAMKA